MPPTPAACPDVARLDLTGDGALLFASDLHLRAAPRRDLRALCLAIDALPDGSIVVLGGDVVELWDAPDGFDPLSALDAHRELVTTARAAVERGIRVLWLIGNHDARLAWEEQTRISIRDLVGCTFARAADIGLPTETGVRRVWCEHGHGDDPFNATASPQATPLGYHVVREILPVVREASGPWFDDIALLQSPAAVGPFIGSRLLYRRLPRMWPTLVAVVVALFALRLAWHMTDSHPTVGQVAGQLQSLAWVALLDAALLTVAAVLWTRRIGQRLSDLVIAEASRARNEAAAASMRSRHPDDIGLVSGHTHVAALHDVPAGFYANPGASTDVVRAVPARLRAPRIFERARQLGWVIVAARDGDVVADLHRASVTDRTARSLLERLLARPDDGTTSPAIVASWPSGPSLRSTDEITADLTSVAGMRRLAAALVATSALVSLVSTMSPPTAERLRLLEALVPLEVALAANAATVGATVLLFVLALGLLRGQRRAHHIAVATLSLAAVGNLVKGFDALEAIVAGGAVLTLVATRDAFTVEAVATDLRRRIAVTAAVVAGAAAVAVAAVVAAGVDTPAAVRQVVGWATLGPTTVVGGRGAVALRFVQVAVALVVPSALAAVALTMLGRRVTDPGLPPDDVRARVLARGTDSLAYFALRDDKRQYLRGDTVVAYAVFGRVALVSPDPIGPPADRTATLDAFASHARRQGWITAVLAAAPEAAAGYREHGWRTLYLGDEAIAWFDQIDLGLHGNHYKSLRASVNRAQRNGYRVELLDPATLTPRQRTDLLAMAGESRRGEAERGFSMTLGRLFDPRDTGLLLAVAWDADDLPGAFCQFVPSADAGGWSLDVMRRRNDTPNGLMDHLLIQTMRQLRDRGCTGLGLNFATMRAVVAGDGNGDDGRTDGVGITMERRVLHALSASFQIESLMVFNRKYDPQWRPRYLVYRSPAHLPEIATAVARAESFWEIPVVGRFLTRPDPPDARPARADTT